MREVKKKMACDHPDVDPTSTFFFIGIRTTLNKLETNNKKSNQSRIFSIGSMSNKEKCRRHKLENDNKEW